MGLVSINDWRAERGFGERPAADQGVQTAAPDFAAQVAALEQEVARQANLIVQLQTALHTYVAREEQAKAAAVAAKRAAPKLARVIRRPRSPK